MAGADEGHVGETDQRRRFRARRRRADAARQGLGEPAFGVRIGDDLETEFRQRPCEHAMVIGQIADPAPRRQFDDAPRRMQSQRGAIERRQQLVIGAEPPRCARGEQDGGDVRGVDHDSHPFGGRLRVRHFQSKLRMIATTPADILRFCP